MGCSYFVISKTSWNIGKDIDLTMMLSNDLNVIVTAASIKADSKNHWNLQGEVFSVT